ncbi:MAG: DNA cytosine methyltransferase [Phycisphaeraceae bacterium]
MIVNATPQLRHKVFAEFFAGIGLVRMGLEPGGWQCGYANDIEPKKFQMYADMFDESDGYHVENIWNTRAVLDRWSTPAFLATASFPCVDLSLAGHWKGFQGEYSSTYFGFIEVLKSLDQDRPKVVMLENVVGFLNANDGKDFRQATTSLAKLGYQLDAIILDAKWFIPQSRPRLFVFGIHESVAQNLCDTKLFEPDVADSWLMSEFSTSPLRPEKLIKAINKANLIKTWNILI